MKSVQNTHNRYNFSDLHDSLLTIVGVLNRPQRDELMIEASQINLDRALFPLLVHIGRFGPIGVVELADRVGRDYTTVSRQVKKLEEAGLARRHKNSIDKRINEAVITAAGREMNDKIDAAREKIYQKIFLQWEESERLELERLLKKFTSEFTELEAIENIKI